MISVKKGKDEYAFSPKRFFPKSKVFNKKKKLFNPMERNVENSNGVFNCIVRISHVKKWIKI